MRIGRIGVVIPEEVGRWARKRTLVAGSGGVSAS
jgi:hypothetical protein